MLNKKNTYLVACSGGPDSMALLDMYRRKDYKLQVAHVNYHKRDTANRDEDIVYEYCHKYNIPFNKLDVFPESVKGNFQSYARKIRYEYFADLCNVFNLSAVLVAHQQDDVIETYLMQKQKKLIVNEYGISSHNQLYGANVIRPLLDYSKADLLAYCNKKNVPYGIDESNLHDDYQRNIIRHSKVESMSKTERAEIIKEILIKNIEKLTIENEALKFIYDKNTYSYDEFLKNPHIKTVIRNIFNIKMSDKYLGEIIKQLNECDSYKLIRNKIALVKEYGRIYYFNMPLSYRFKVNKDDLFYTDYFKIQRTGKDNFSCAYVKDDDYPLTIRNYQEGDSIQMLYGTKKINRYFIDNKILFKDRLVWPVVLNNQGSAILVPGIGCDKYHYDKKPNLYVIKL